MTTEAPTQVAAPRGYFDLANVLAFVLGLSIQTTRIPDKFVPMPARVEMMLFVFMTTWPFMVAWMFLALPRARPDRLWTVASVAVGSFVTSTFIALLSSTDEKMLTMIGSTVAICVFMGGARRLAGPLIASDGVPFYRGLQIGFLLMAAYLVQSGSFTSFKYHSYLEYLGFVDTAGIYRNAVTQLATIALCASLADLSRRGASRNFMVVFDVAVAAVAIYLTYRIPAKGAWISTIVVLAAFLLAAIAARRYWLAFAMFAGALAVAPLMADRLQTYLAVYFSDPASQGLTGRTAFWQYAWTVISDRGAYLMGFGFDSAFGASNVFGVAHFHNEFVNALYCGGVVGVTFLTAWIGFYIYRVTKSVSERASGENSRIIVFCFLYAAFIVSRLMTEVPITNFTEPLPIWVLCTAIMSMVGAQVVAPLAEVAGRRWGALVAAPRRIRTSPGSAL